MWASELVEPILEALILLIGFGYGVGHFVPSMGGQSYVEFFAPAALAQMAMYTATFESTFSLYERMQHQRTFEAIITSPVSLDEVVSGEIVWSASKSVITGTITLAMFSTLGLIPSPMAALTPLALLCQGLAFASMATAVTAIVPHMSATRFYISGLIAPMFLLSDAFFPLDTLPMWLQHLGHALPLFHAVHLARSLARGQLTLDLLCNAAYLLALAAVASVIAINLIRRRLIK